MKKEENTEDKFLKDLAPRLFEKQITVNTDPPEGYFDNLLDQIMNKIQALPEKGVSPVFHSDNDPVASSEYSMPAENEFTDLDNYDDENDLYEALGAEDISTILNTESLTDDEIIEYLMREGYSEDLILDNI